MVTEFIHLLRAHHWVLRKPPRLQYLLVPTLSTSIASTAQARRRSTERHAPKCYAASRQLCPGTPISLTTSATIVSDPIERLRIVEAWDVLPDLVSANQGEAGIYELCQLLFARGVEIEAGLLSVSDARAFVASGLAARCRRALVEPLDLDVDVALRTAAEMERVLQDGGVLIEQVHHGCGIANWAVNERALKRGHGIRTGLEDVTVLPDGSPAQDNVELVKAALELVRVHARA